MCHDRSRRSDALQTNISEGKFAGLCWFASDKNWYCFKVILAFWSLLPRIVISLITAYCLDCLPLTILSYDMVLFVLFLCSVSVFHPAHVHPSFLVFEISSTEGFLLGPWRFLVAEPVLAASFVLPNSGATSVGRFSVYISFWLPSMFHLIIIPLGLFYI